MSNYTRITVPLSRDEFVALRDAAAKERREPRQQAAWLLRQVLLQGNQEAQPQTQPVRNEEMALA